MASVTPRKLREHGNGYAPIDLDRHEGGETDSSHEGHPPVNLAVGLEDVSYLQVRYCTWMRVSERSVRR